MRRSLMALGVLCAATLAVAAPSGFRLKKGDRVLFYGDSITEQRLYTNYIETFVVTRFPTLEVRFRNVGVGGDRVTGGWAGPIDTRLTRDFYPYKPTVATIMLGMNDGSYRAFDQGIFDTYSQGYKKIVAGIRSNVPGCSLFLIQPSPFDDVAHKPNWDPGYNAVLATYGEFVKKLAGQNKAEAIDLNGPLVANLQNAVEIDSAAAANLIADRVHPGPQFQLLMAAEVLKAWGAPSIVSDISIDFSKRAVTKSTAAKVMLQTGLEWTQYEGSLPFPLKTDDKLVSLVLKSSDFVRSLNREMLTLTGLAAGSYDLQIDGKTVETFTRDQLAAGVNLALLSTPMTEQAFKVQELTNKQINLFFDVRWRGVQMPCAGRPHTAQALKALDMLEEDLVREQHAAAKPVPHAFKLVAKPAAPTVRRPSYPSAKRRSASSKSNPSPARKTAILTTGG